MISAPQMEAIGYLLLVASMVLLAYAGWQRIPPFFGAGVPIIPMGRLRVVRHPHSRKNRKN